jgi:uncharacterized RDD family membrane protein YckC
VGRPAKGRSHRPGSVDEVSDPSSSAASAEPSYPGERLGLPPLGKGSVAGWGRRVLALFVDWLAASLAAALVFGFVLFGDPQADQGSWVPFTPHLVFLLEATLLTPLLGGSFGQLLCRVSVVRLDNRPLNVLQALLRTFLILLVIPPLVFNRDQRGLHDLAVGTITLRR